jgi:glycosyltransferase involved in cell wall biosynthesis
MRYSVVIPIYNEAENILPLVEELEWVMKSDWELILVDDGSTDESPKIVQKLAEQKSSICTILLKKNYGQTSALCAGIQQASGEWILTLDGDLQNDPRDIPHLIDASFGCHMVSGIRQKRKDPFYKRVISRLANAARRRLLQDNTEDTGCSLKLFKKECFMKLPRFNGMHRFLPALFQIEGFITKEIPVHHRERRRGKSKYTLFNRGFALFSDLLAVAWMKRRKLTFEIELEV